MLSKDNFLFLDLGTKTGWCIALERGAETLVSGTKNFKKVFCNDAQIYSDFREFLNKIITEHLIGSIVYEQVMGGHKGTIASHFYGALEGILKETAFKYNIKLEGITPTSIKKQFTGYGKATKKDMIEKCRKNGHDPIDDNEADALAMYYIKLSGE